MKRPQVRFLIAALVLGMYSRLELGIAWSYLFSKSFRGLVTLLSLIGIAIGVAALIVVTSVMNGFRSELLSSIIGMTGHVNVRVHNYTYDDFSQLSLSMKNLYGISSIVPSLESQSVISNGTDSYGVLVKGMRQMDLKREKDLPARIIFGDLSTFDNGLVLGKRLAESLNVVVGDELTLISPSYNNTMMGPIPRMKTLKVMAIFSFGVAEHDSNVVYIPFEIASIFFKSKLNNVNIYLDDPNLVDDFVVRLRAMRADLDFISWKESDNPYMKAIKMEKSIMSIILMMIIIVAAFNIISGLFMLVDEKRQAIAILRTIGMSKSAVVRIFIFCGGILGVIGTTFGLILGLLLTFNIDDIRLFIERVTKAKLFDPSVYFVDRIPILVSSSEVCSIAAIALVMALIATIAPAYKASKQDPARVLR